MNLYYLEIIIWAIKHFFLSDRIVVFLVEGKGL